MKKQQIFKYTSLGLLGVLAGCKETVVEKKPLNILFIMTDDHSYQTISSYDNRYIETPNIDRIGQQGVVFNNGFVGNSICGPSRATMLTGKYSHANGMLRNDKPFDGSQQTFPKILQANGYQTAVVGKWHLESYPTGFDHWEIFPGQGEYYNPDFINMQGDTVRFEGYATDLTTDKALGWLDSRDKSKPFALLLHHKAPHRSWQPDTAHLAEFAGKIYPIPETFYDDYEGRIAAQEQKMSIRTGDMDLVYDLKLRDDKKAGIKGRFGNIDHTWRMNEEQRAKWNSHYDTVRTNFKKERPTGKDLQEWKFQHYMQDYLACIRSVDNNVGRVLEYLKENGLEENTLVIYTADQGFYMGEHGWFDKRFMYEESFRTPILMQLPKGFEAKGTIEELVQNIDFAPTFLDLAGVDIPEDMHGLSLLPILRTADADKHIDLRDALYYHYYEFPNEHMVKRHYGIRTDRYKLIHFYNDIDVWELYDLEKDKSELNNLYGKEGYEQLTKELKERLQALQEQYKDTDRTTY